MYFWSPGKTFSLLSFIKVFRDDALELNNERRKTSFKSHNSIQHCSQRNMMRSSRCFFFSAKRVCLICISPCVLLFVFTSTNSDLNWTVFRPYYSAKFLLIHPWFIIYNFVSFFFLFRKTSMSMQDFPFINFWLTEADVNKMCESSLIFDIDVGK